VRAKLSRTKAPRRFGMQEKGNVYKKVRVSAVPMMDWTDI